MGLNIDRGDGVNTEMGASFIKEDLFYPRFKSRRGWQMGTGRLHLEQIQELYFKVTLASIILAKAFEREQIQRLLSHPRFTQVFFKVILVSAVQRPTFDPLITVYNLVFFMLTSESQKLEEVRKTCLGDKSELSHPFCCVIARRARPPPPRDISMVCVCEGVFV